MKKIYYVDRATGEHREELVYHEKALHYLYGKGTLSRFFLTFVAKYSFFSHLVGWWQRRSFTRKKIAPFIETYGIDAREFVKKVEDFTSFDDFFVRKLKKEARPLNSDEKRAILPADGRFLFYPDIEKADGFVVKGRRFSISQLINDEHLTKLYRNGSLVIGRLCPTDYHRFHFPCSGIPSASRLVNGPLYSVNPVALQQNLSILSENKRMITVLDSDHFGKVLMIEVGATCVGTIHQTFKPNHPVKKGEEKGFFSFGGSSLLLLFEANQIQFDHDLLKASSQHIETLCLMGQSLGNK